MTPNEYVTMMIFFPAKTMMMMDMMLDAGLLLMYKLPLSDCQWGIWVNQASAE